MGAATAAAACSLRDVTIITRGTPSNRMQPLSSYFSRFFLLLYFSFLFFFEIFNWSTSLYKTDDYAVVTVVITLSLIPYRHHYPKS